MNNFHTIPTSENFKLKRLRIYLLFATAIIALLSVTALMIAKNNEKLTQINSATHATMYPDLKTEIVESARPAPQNIVQTQVTLGDKTQ